MKSALRQQAMVRRDALMRGKGDIGVVLADHLKAALDRLPLEGLARSVAGYYPIRSEANVLPVLALMAQKGWQTGLPAIPEPGAPLAFRRWSAGEVLTDGPYGTKVPAGGEKMIPGIVLVPLLAYDRDGHRLGYGGGFYDRTLGALRTRGAVLALGIAYAAQEVDTLLAEDHDEPLDGILTENDLMMMNRG